MAGCKRIFSALRALGASPQSPRFAPRLARLYTQRLHCVGYIIRNLLLLSVLGMASACRCWFFCYDDTSIQRNYVADRDDCQDDAEQNVGYFSSVTMSSRERNTRLLQEFAKCMASKNWGVSQPKTKEKPKEEASLPPRPTGIPPGDVYTARSGEAEETESTTTRERVYENNTVVQQRSVVAGQPAPQQRSAVNRNVVVMPPSGQNTGQQPVVNHYHIYQQPAMQSQQPPPRVIERNTIREVPVMRNQPAPPPRVIERNTIREVPVIRTQPAPPPQVIERRYIQQNPPSSPPPQYQSAPQGYPAYQPYNSQSAVPNPRLGKLNYHEGYSTHFHGDEEVEDGTDPARHFELGNPGFYGQATSTK